MSATLCVLSTAAVLLYSAHECHKLALRACLPLPCGMCAVCDSLPSSGDRSPCDLQGQPLYIASGTFAGYIFMCGTRVSSPSPRPYGIWMRTPAGVWTTPVLSGLAGCTSLSYSSFDESLTVSVRRRCCTKRCCTCRCQGRATRASSLLLHLQLHLHSVLLCSSTRYMRDASCIDCRTRTTPPSSSTT